MTLEHQHDKPPHALPQNAHVQKLMAQMEDAQLPSEAEVLSIIAKATHALDSLPSLAEVVVPQGAKMHVVGDIHGQYSDLKRVLELCELPYPERNYFVFNGDFVDRGDQSTEVIIALLVLFIMYPGCVFLNRGNHETRSMNRRYGFEDEVLNKYSRKVFNAFHDAFDRLPLATLINKSVLVLHGGLFKRDGVTLQDIADINRKCEPRSGLIMDLLWSDPTPRPGRQPSRRGAGVHFGPDVAERFCKENSLLCCIRSHEVVQHGFEWQDGGRCLTVFSAANYTGQAGNLGAVCHISPTGAHSISLPDLTFDTYEGQPSRRMRMMRSRL